MEMRQVIVGALVIAVVCCAVMWALEGFRQRQMIEDLRAALAKLPEVPEPGVP